MSLEAREAESEDAPEEVEQVSRERMIPETSIQMRGDSIEPTTQKTREDMVHQDTLTTSTSNHEEDTVEKEVVDTNMRTMADPSEVPTEIHTMIGQPIMTRDPDTRTNTFTEADKNQSTSLEEASE